MRLKNRLAAALMRASRLAAKQRSRHSLCLLQKPFADKAAAKRFFKRSWPPVPSTRRS